MGMGHWWNVEGNMDMEPWWNVEGNMVVGHWWNVEGNTEPLEVKPVTVPLRLPQIQRGPAWDRKPVSSP
jgi:hypothetical protein